MQAEPRPPAPLLLQQTSSRARWTRRRLRQRSLRDAGRSPLASELAMMMPTTPTPRPRLQRRQRGAGFSALTSSPSSTERRVPVVAHLPLPSSPPLPSALATAPPLPLPPPPPLAGRARVVAADVTPAGLARHSAVAAVATSPLPTATATTTAAAAVAAAEAAVLWTALMALLLCSNSARPRAPSLAGVQRSLFSRCCAW